MTSFIWIVVLYLLFKHVAKRFNQTPPTSRAAIWKLFSAIKTELGNVAETPSTDPILNRLQLPLFFSRFAIGIVYSLLGMALIGVALRSALTSTNLPFGSDPLTLLTLGAFGIGILFVGVKILAKSYRYARTDTKPEKSAGTLDYFKAPHPKPVSPKRKKNETQFKEL